MAVKAETRKLIKAFTDGNTNKVAAIQHKIFNMHATHAIAVKETLNKSGSKTPGVDGVV